MSDDERDDPSGKAKLPRDAEKRLLAEAAATAARYAPLIETAKQFAEQNRPIVDAARRLADMDRPIIEAAAKLGAVHEQQFRALSTSLAAIVPKLDDVIRQSTISAGDLRAMLPLTDRIPTMDLETAPMAPLRSREDYLAERIENAIDQLTEVAAKTADITAANGELAKAQTTALAAGLDALRETTREAITAGEARDRAGARRESVLVGLTWALVVVAVTSLLQDLWRGTEPLRDAGTWLIHQIGLP